MLHLTAKHAMVCPLEGNSFRIEIVKCGILAMTHKPANPLITALDVCSPSFVTLAVGS